MGWRWRRYVPPKRRFLLLEPHGVLSQKTTSFIVTAVKTTPEDRGLQSYTKWEYDSNCKAVWVFESSSGLSLLYVRFLVNLPTIPPPPGNKQRSVGASPVAISFRNYGVDGNLVREIGRKRALTSERFCHDVGNVCNRCDRYAETVRIALQWTQRHFRRPKLLSTTTCFDTCVPSSVPSLVTVVPSCSVIEKFVLNICSCNNIFPFCLMCFNSWRCLYLCWSLLSQQCSFHHNLLVPF
jgi:hypothetical protein